MKSKLALLFSDAVGEELTAREQSSTRLGFLELHSGVPSWSCAQHMGILRDGIEDPGSLRPWLLHVQHYSFEWTTDASPEVVCD